MRFFLLLTAIAIGLSACAPKALYFHESTKVAFAADYNVSDTQPLATSLGYKRRIVAVVPAQERNIPDGGTERNGTNSGEALSLVSKFNVRAGAHEGIVITNNFASGMAARIMTRSAGSPEALNVLMHSAPIPVTASGETGTGRPAAEVVNERIARIMGKRTTEVPPSRRTIDATPEGGMMLKGRTSGVPGSTRGVDLDKKGDVRIQPVTKPAAKPVTVPKKPDVPASTRTVDLDENGEAKITNPKKPVTKPAVPPRKPDVPASSRSVDLSPEGEAVIRKR